MIRISKDEPTPVEEELARRSRRQMAVLGLVLLAVLAVLALRRAS
ncbi:MAG TPA: hypothetical protein VNM48_10110 [Chloroflexota bacterium]|nr:hypothetical protein [Chloroflexota bacterium]